MRNQPPGLRTGDRVVEEQRLGRIAQRVREQARARRENGDGRRPQPSRSRD